MNEFLPRTEPAAPLASATERRYRVRTVTAASPATSRTDAAANPPAPRRDAPHDAASATGGSDAVARALAAYADVRNRTRGVVSDLANSPKPPSPSATAQAEDDLVSLLPQPAVIHPLPPANQDMVRFVSEVTASIARQAAQARAAMSGASPAMVEAATD